MHNQTLFLLAFSPTTRFMWQNKKEKETKMEIGIFEGEKRWDLSGGRLEEEGN